MNIKHSLVLKIATKRQESCFIPIELETINKIIIPTTA